MTPHRGLTVLEDLVDDPTSDDSKMALNCERIRRVRQEDLSEESLAFWEAMEKLRETANLVRAARLVMAIVRSAHCCRANERSAAGRRTGGEGGARSGRAELLRRCLEGRVG